MSLKSWQNKGWLFQHKSSPEEIADLLAIAERDLHDCRSQGLSPDWCLNIAHNAALGLANAALAASGFRAAKEAHHYRVIQSLAFTLNLDPKVVKRLDAFRKKRNISGYDRAGTTSSSEAKEMVALAEDLKTALIRWLKKHHPELM